MTHDLVVRLLTAEERDFLERVRDGRVLKLADRPQDRVQQPSYLIDGYSLANAYMADYRASRRAALEKETRE